MPESATVRVTCVSQSGGTVLSVSGPDHFYSSVRSLNFCGRPSEPADERMDENEPGHEHSPHDMAKNTGLSHLGIVSLRVASAHGDPMPQTTAVSTENHNDPRMGGYHYLMGAELCTTTTTRDGVKVGA